MLAKGIVELELDEFHPQVYYPRLDIMRFVAAYVVLLSHVELSRGLMGLPSNWFNHWAELAQSGHQNLWELYSGSGYKLSAALGHEAGAMSVIFFFVLSGFLITLLLLREHDHKGDIDISRFYLRRIFRIWPLNFLVVLLGLYVLPHVGDWFFVSQQSPNLDARWWALDLPYLLVLPNVSNGLMLGEFPPNIGQAWSIGVEEQFYLFWPWLFLAFRKRLVWLFVFIGGCVCLKGAALALGFPASLVQILASMKFESMAIGGIGALALHYKKLPAIHSDHWNGLLCLAITAVVVSFFFCPKQLQDGLFLFQSACFLIVVIAGIKAKGLLPKKTGAVLQWLGRRSYGIYMWHMMILTLSNHLLVGTAWAQQFPILTTSLLATPLTVAVSHLSYAYFESPFLRWKARLNAV